MAFTFPSSPTTNQTFTVGSRTYTWTGSVWEMTGGLITTSQLTDLGVTTAKINDLAVTAGKIANTTITATQIASDAVTQAKIADRAVGSAELTNLSLNAQTGTTYTLTLTDAQKLVTLNNASGITLTVPTNATVAFTIGDQVNLMQLGAGQITVAASAGVTVSSQGTKLKLNGQYATGTLVKVATDSWVLIGNLAA